MHRSKEHLYSITSRVLHAIGPSIHPMGKSGCTFSQFDTVKEISPGPPLAGCTYPSGVIAPRAQRMPFRRPSASRPGGSRSSHRPRWSSMVHRPGHLHGARDHGVAVSERHHQHGMLPLALIACARLAHEGSSPCGLASERDADGLRAAARLGFVVKASRTAATTPTSYGNTVRTSPVHPTTPASADVDRHVDLVVGTDHVLELPRPFALPSARRFCPPTNGPSGRGYRACRTICRLARAQAGRPAHSAHIRACQAQWWNPEGSEV
jgi:hypothetical protein